MQVHRSESLGKYGISLHSGPVSDPGLGPSGMEALQPCPAASPPSENEPATFTTSPIPSKLRSAGATPPPGPAKRSSGPRRRPAMSGKGNGWSLIDIDGSKIWESSSILKLRVL